MRWWYIRGNEKSRKAGTFIGMIQVFVVGDRSTLMNRPDQEILVPDNESSDLNNEL